MQPGLRFDLGEGWRTTELYDDTIQLGWGGTGKQYLTFHAFDGRANVLPCFVPEGGAEGDLAELDFLRWSGQPDNITEVGTTEADLWNHLAENPHLTIGEVAEVRAGDLVVQQADLQPAVAEDCFDERALLWYGQHGWIVDLGNGEQMRLATFDVADEVLAIEARTRAGAADHEAFLAAVDELLETLTISETPVE